MTKKCIIAGNGPSLNDMPVHLLEDMPSFGVNYCPFFPDYYVCVDHDILINFPDKISSQIKAAKTAYIAAKEAETSYLLQGKNVHLVWKDENKFKAEKFMSGFTVVYVALKMAFYLGFDEIHLFGVDHSPAWDHYVEGYPKGDVNGRKARMQVMEWHYALTQSVYKADGRRILNHSNASKLDLIFERAE